MSKSGKSGPAENDNGRRSGTGTNPFDFPSWMMEITTTINRNLQAMASLSEFPSGQPSPRPDSAFKGGSEAGMQAMASSWKRVGDAMMGSFDAVWAGQRNAAEKASEQMATAIRDMTGMDPRAMMAGTGAEWSPQTVAFQSFGLADSDAAAMATELTQLAMTSGEAARTMFELYRVVGDAWLQAAEKFAEANAEGAASLSDPTALQRQWIATAEPILQERLASAAFTKANADFIRASSLHSKARSALARRFTDMIEAPNRQEMTETYEAIQELRREVRTLRRDQKRLEHALAVARQAPAETE